MMLNPTLPPMAAPVTAFIEATVPSLLAHVPPAVGLANIVAEPWQIFVLPAIAAGSGLTTIVLDLEQPVDSEPVMVTVPAI